MSESDNRDVQSESAEGAGVDSQVGDAPLASCVPYAAGQTAAEQPERPEQPAQSPQVPQVSQPEQPEQAPVPLQQAVQPHQAQQAYAGSYGDAQNSYSASYGASQQSSSAPYGTPQQPVSPVAPPVQNIYPGYEPPNPNQKRRWPWFLLGLFAGIVIGMGGCAGCVGCMALAGYSSYDDSFGGYDEDYYYNNHDYDYYDHDYDYDYGHDYNDLYAYPPEDDYQLYDEDDLSAYGLYTFDEIVELFAADGVTPEVPDANDRCAAGIYQVGRRGDIPAGLYFMEGSNEMLSHFYVFERSDSAYEFDDGVQYFGNYFADLEEGEVVVFIPGADVDMYPAPAASFEPQEPYVNGCYRVGIDIPAGTYIVTAHEVGQGETEDDSAAYVMDDLDWDDDSVVDVQYVIPGGKQTVTVRGGQYLELFAAEAVLADQN